MCRRKNRKSKDNLLVLYGDVPVLEITTLKKLTNKVKNNISMLGFESLVPKGYGRIKRVKNNILEVIEEKNLKGSEKT